MLALLYDIHGNLPALEAVLADASGADRWLLGGDMAPFGPYPDETLDRLQALEGAIWIRGNTERWLVDREDLRGPMTEAVEACRAVIGDARADELAALPERAALDGGVAVHASPVSDMRSFLPQPRDDEGELLAGSTAPRLFFGHTHLQFRRAAVGAATELVNPGSVGMPLDGDRRAAYALLHDDGSVELRRVAYDWEASVRALRRRFGGRDWVRIVSARIELSRFDVAA
jgi:diadenosine tetraphosphatase ApaH/serine/threonine PP2A family protein phosphatase